LSDIPIWVAASAVILVAAVAEHFRRRAASLRRNNANLSRELAAARAEVAEGEKARSDLLSRIGVTLRKPLASIRNASDEVSRTFDCPQWVREQLSLLAVEVDNISRFIDLIGEIASLERPSDSKDSTSGKPAGPALDLEGMLTSIIQEASPRLSEKGISLAAAIDPDVHVKGDERYLRQALESLLMETLRHAGRGSVLSIDLSGDGRSAHLALDYRGAQDPDAAGSVLGTELARQVIGVHGGWLQEGSKRGQFQAGLPLAGVDDHAEGLEEDEQEYLQEI